MITPSEIKKKANRQYKPFLISTLKSDSLFPLHIKGNKGKSKLSLTERYKGLKLLMAEAKATKGFGYTLVLKEINTRHAGLMSLPNQIYFETPTDFLQFIGKAKEFENFEKTVHYTLATLPQLQDWLENQPMKLIKYLNVWEDLLKVCQYFLAQPQPNCYIRELPIAVHTKFIEQHQGILKDLLDYLLDEKYVNVDEKQFEKRFGLKYDEPTIRFRLIGNNVIQNIPVYLTDLSLPISQFQQLQVIAQDIFIVENKQTFLAFPKIPNSMVIWGKGFGVEMLKSVNWLQSKSIIYWGDIDVQGFQILSQLRGYFPQTQSLLMDKTTFTAFKSFVVTGKTSPVQTLQHLTETEHLLFNFLKQEVSNNRLEQERISQEWVLERLNL